MYGGGFVRLERLSGEMVKRPTPDFNAARLSLAARVEQNYFCAAGS